MKEKYNFSQILGKALLIIGLVAFGVQAEASCKYERMIDAEEIGVGILLNWSTCHEQDNSMFIVERSNDGLHFVNLGAVKGAGQSNIQQEYSFLDIQPDEGQVFYRLRQINFSGTYSFSEVLAVNKEHSNHFMVNRISAAAATTHFEVNIDARSENQLTYTLLDWKGNEISAEEMSLIMGSNKISVDLRGLPVAIYRLELQVNEEIETLTFKKVKEARAPHAKLNAPCSTPLNQIKN